MSKICEFQNQLAQAREALGSILKRGRSTNIPIAEYSLANEKVLEAERALAAATGDQYATPLNLGFYPEAGVSGPLLLQNDNGTILTFNAVEIATDDSRGKRGTACIEFDLCFWTTFGYPNDEALSGHPLYGRGLNAYRIFDVHNSHWGRRKIEQNRIAFPNTPEFNSRHLIFTFHDSTFECICKGIKSASFSTTPYLEIFSVISNKVLERHQNHEK
ncbi:MAG TPA: hypothetical protein VK742_00070 [Candidatus Sulfotelmatobacter sp.]|nr:hypothetical protein [Candidatus Sulfotelmatobacter sp.]